MITFTTNHNKSNTKLTKKMRNLNEQNIITSTINHNKSSTKKQKYLQKNISSFFIILFSCLSLF